MSLPEHRRVSGGFECECGAFRRTPLGMNRHLATCDGGADE
jgi:hypothetical protein